MQLTDTNNPLISGLIADLNNPNLSKEDWFQLHAKCVAAKHLGSKLVKFSRDRATSEWGVEFVADSEVQIEMDLGITFHEEKPRLNPADKSTGIVTIEATNASFLAWERKMHDERRGWDVERKRKLWELLKPMVEVGLEIKQEIGA
jgi:hypothetical protein